MYLRNSYYTQYGTDVRVAGDFWLHFKKKTTYKHFGDYELCKEDANRFGFKVIPEGEVRKVRITVEEI